MTTKKLTKKLTPIMGSLKNPGYLAVVSLTVHMHLTPNPKAICSMWAQRSNQVGIRFKATRSHWASRPIEEMSNGP
jgi:hypothetical protein